jgi:diguanylate cyclase (GGDEF)-like protein
MVLMRGYNLNTIKSITQGICVTLMTITAWLVMSFNAMALEPVSVSVDDIALDITDAIEPYKRQDGTLKISTAPDAEGIVRRIEVRSKKEEGSISYWAVFSLANTSDEQIDRLIVAPHYRMINSGIVWPDLDTDRLLAITPSEGFSLDRQTDTDADVFFLTLDPGAVITLIAEQQTAKLPKLTLWEPSAYKDTANSYSLYYGIVLGISGLLAVFLTIIFVIKGSAMFPATAGIAWGVLAYICVDFGFLNRIIGGEVSNEPFWRASTEVFLAASLVIFIYAYLNLNRWNRNLSFLVIAWILFLIILMGVALFEPHVAAGIARLSIASTVVFGVLLLIYQSFNKFDRAVMLIPTWILLIAWLAAAGITVLGRIENDVIQPALGGGLVLVVLLLCFTVMQHAFTGGAFAQGLISDAERSALGLTGAGDILWDWDVNTDKITADAHIGHLLKQDIKSFNTNPLNWQKMIHPNDRDRFSFTLSAILEHKRGRISQAFRMRDGDGHYQWFKLRARPMLDTSGEVSRCIGTLTDITDQKKSEERLLQDSVRDHLTGLENRGLFTSRLETIIQLAHQKDDIRPSIFFIDIDGFNKINTTLGFAVGDTILLTLARRLTRLLKNGDSMARLSGDQFAILLLSETEPKKIAEYADAIRRTIMAPIDYSEEEIVLSSSIGVASWSPEHVASEQMMRDAELAKDQAKREGGNKTVPFLPAYRQSKDDSIILQEDLSNAIADNQLQLFYQPIVSLTDSKIRGFEALLRWNHPKLGMLMPADFVPLAEQSGLINELGIFAINSATADFAQLNQQVGGNCFVSVNLSSRELLRSDIIADIRNALDLSGLPADQLRIELTESMVMENPEHSTQIMARIKAMGVGISLDDFGTGYSSLSYLLKVPFDVIKIDKSFVQAREQHERLIILRSIIALGHSLNQAIIAEGVEYESDATDLMQLGCEFAQGYLFGEPVTIEGAKQMIESEQT